MIPRPSSRGILAGLEDEKLIGDQLSRLCEILPESARDEIWRELHSVAADKENLSFVGESIGGLVKVTINNRKDVIKTEIELELNSERKTLLEEAITSACANANQKLEEREDVVFSEINKIMSYAA